MHKELKQVPQKRRVSFRDWTFKVFEEAYPFVIMPLRPRDFNSKHIKTEAPSTGMGKNSEHWKVEAARPL